MVFHYVWAGIMSVKFGVRVTHYGIIAKAMKVKQSTINTWVRAAMMEAAKLWIEEFRPRHFGKAAFYKYAYKPRSAWTQAAKRALEAEGLIPLPRNEWRGAIHPRVIRVYGRAIFARPGAFSNEPFFWTGQMKDKVLNQNVYAPIARATAKRQHVRVPVALGHPVPTGLAPEVVTLLPSEMNRMHQRAHAVLSQLVLDPGQRIVYLLKG